MNDLCRQLVELIRPLHQCVVAFSGGVDSAVVAKAAREALGFEYSQAITAVGPSVSRSELETAKKVAREIGIQHRLVATNEIEIADYVVNDGRRCFYCKSELYSKLHQAFEQVDASWTILNGTNVDDLGDYRPGLQAAANYQVRSPLAELQINKSSVREIARSWGLSVSQKPAAPCLASRIAYGESVTIEKLQMVEAAEEVLRTHLFRQFRVRFLPNQTARIEVEKTDLGRLQDSTTFQSISSALKRIGFQEVTVDPKGFRSGNLNRMLSDQELNLSTYKIGN